MGGNGNRAGDEEGDSRPSLEGLAQQVARRRGQATPSSGSQNEAEVGGMSASPEASEFIFPADEETPQRETFGAATETDALLKLVVDTPNLLLLGPGSCPVEYDLCSRLLSAADGDPANLLLVTYTESPDKRLDLLDGHLGGLPQNVVVIGVGSFRKSRRESASSDQTRSEEVTAIETISNPTNIQRLGITISQYLAEWESSAGKTIVCFHSLSALLNVVDDAQRVFRFLNTLFGRVHSVDATAHYHMDPEAHDQETISTFRPMFDEIVTFDEEGSPTIDRKS